MAIETPEDLLRELCEAQTATAVRTILESIGDHADVEPGKPFGEINFVWHPFGNNESNISTIGLGTHPGRSLTERITNAQDAVLEDQVRHGVAPPDSARKAAEAWFGRPISGRESGLFQWEHKDLDRKIAITLLKSEVDDRPTIDVMDEGIGIRPDEFERTILSLQGGNKIKKWYLIGAFGQGGAATMAFSEYTIIISRHRDHPGEIGFTVVRVLKLGASFKEDCYAYLAVSSKEQRSIPRCGHQPDKELRLYEQPIWTGRQGLTRGTVVRHVSYALTGLEKALGPSPTNLWHYLHVSMFDPLLPFSLVDLRTKRKLRVITGSRNRLMRLATKGTLDEEEKERGPQHLYHRPMEFVVPHGGVEPSIGLELWVVQGYQKGKDETRRPMKSSHELYVKARYPVVGSLNGQNQGELPGRIIRDAGLQMLSRHMVVHIDASSAPSQIRRQLFSTSREGFKDGPVLNGLTQVLSRILEEDENLAELEREFTKRLIDSETEDTKEEVKTEVTRLLKEAGFQPAMQGIVETSGDGDEEPTGRPRKGGRYRKAAPLPTLPYPNVTKFEIVWPVEKLTVHIADHETILVETDADSEFDRRGLVFIRSEPPALELLAKVPLQGGRIRWRLRPTSGSFAGQVGQIVVAITRSDGTQLTDKIDFEVLPALTKKTKKGTGPVPRFRIIAVDPDGKPDDWANAWSDLSEEGDPTKLASVAYKPVMVSDAIIVYYSTIFTPFKEQLDKLKTRSEALAQRFTTEYEIWVAYHAILQNQFGDSDVGNIDDEMFDQIQEQERCRVAMMEVKQAVRTAELQQKLAAKDAAGD